LTISNTGTKRSEASLVKSNDTFKLFDNNPWISINSKDGRKYLNVSDLYVVRVFY
jgi:hypothetical protein